MFDEWLMVLAMGWLVVVVPGPNFAMTLRNSLTRSRRAGLFTAFGVSLGGVGHVTYSLIGIALLISQSIFLFNTLKRLGALYLIYLGIRALLARKHDQPSPQRATAAPRPGALRADHRGLRADLVHVRRAGKLASG
ncbi:MAG: LysE family translocator, partial [Chloroflexota bacterium]